MPIENTDADKLSAHVVQLQRELDKAKREKVNIADAEKLSARVVDLQEQLDIANRVKVQVIDTFEVAKMRGELVRAQAENVILIADNDRLRAEVATLIDNPIETV